MILKFFEIEKYDISKKNYYLFYGENEGLKNNIIKDKFKNLSKNIFRYDENEILKDKENFFNSLVSGSFFENEKIIIISRASDKIKEFIEEIIEKKINEIIIILNSSLLEKRSKLRGFFEKDKNTVCVAFYPDTQQILSSIASIFFREKNISISQQTINLIVDRSKGDRHNLNNELEKIESYTINKKSISIEEVLILTNLAENYNVTELIDNCLAMNEIKTANILNENNYSSEDCILIIRTLLNKSKRLQKIISENENSQNIENIISSFKPPIFWKDKEIVKQQVKRWSLSNIERLIFETTEIELLIKKNLTNSVNILSDFIISQTKRINS